MNDLSQRIYVHCVQVRWLWRSEKDIRCSGTGVTDDFEQQCGCLERNLGPLQKHLLLLSAELSLQCYLLYSLNILLIHLIYVCRWIYICVVARKQLVRVSFLL